MLRRVGLTALFLALLATLPLAAQQQTTLFPSQSQASSFLSGVNPAQRVLVPINLTKATQPFQNAKNAIRTPQMPSSPFSLSNLMPKVKMPSFPITIGSSNVPKSPVVRQKTS